MRLPVVPELVIHTPYWGFAEMTLRAPEVVPPMVFPMAPSLTISPTMLPSAPVPAASVPMKLAETVLPVVPTPDRYRPMSLPEIRLRAAVVAPPMVFPVGPTSMPTPVLLGMAAVPAAFVPIRFPAMTLPFVPDPEREIPVPMLPEMTLRAAVVVPPTVLEVAPPSMAMPEPL